MRLSKITIFLIVVSFLAVTHALNNGLFDLNENQRYIFEIDNEDFIEDEVLLGKRSEQSSQMPKKLVQSLIFSRVNPTLPTPSRPPKISS